MQTKCIGGIPRSVLAFLLFAGSALGQAQFGQITGLVVDQTGAGIGGADVTVKNEKTGVEFKTVSNTDGN